jgi:cysteine desulfuration protein SufE
VAEHPFGTDVIDADIVDALGFLDGWEDRYRYIIELGRQVPPMSDADKREELIVRGCQSQVWLDASRDADGRLHFRIDSDAHIVRGLIALVLAAFEGKRPEAVLDYDIEAYFGSLDLLSHLSPTRGNGLRAMVNRIRDIARGTQVQDSVGSGASPRH